MILFIKREKLIAFFKVLICLLTLLLCLRLFTASALPANRHVPPGADTAKFQIHKVEKGETLYSLAKNNSISIDKLLELNPQIINNNLEAGTTIKLPKADAVATKKMEYKGIGPGAALEPQYHKVLKGETLYSLGKRTDSEVEVLKLWNNLKSDEIKVGQNLIVGYSDGNVPNTEPVETVESEKKPDEPVVASTSPAPVKHTAKVKPATAKTVKPLQVNAKATSTTTTTSPAPANTKNTNTAPSTVTEKNPSSSSVYNSDRRDEKLVYISAKGLCTWIRGGSDNGKCYALHPTAPIGSSISVKNMMNNRSVQVKVIGRLPATPENENIAIKISATAAKALGAVDEKFLISLSYMGYETAKEMTLK